MTAVKIENIKCELNEEESWKSQGKKIEKVKCNEGDYVRVKIEPVEHDHEFTDFREAAERPTNYFRPPPKTPAERKRTQREKEKRLKRELGLTRVRGPPKSAAERKRAQREREKHMRIQIDLLYPERLEKIPGESKKQRVEREKQLKLELGLITPKGPPKTAAERKRAQRERERKMKVEAGLVGGQEAKETDASMKGKKPIPVRKPPKSGAERMRDYRERKRQQNINLCFSRSKGAVPKSPAQLKWQLLQLKGFKSQSTNTQNTPTELKSVLKPAKPLTEDQTPKAKYATGENTKHVHNLEFINCTKIEAIGNVQVPHFIKEKSDRCDMQNVQIP